jgi:hypothetical protein
MGSVLPGVNQADATDEARDKEPEPEATWAPGANIPGGMGCDEEGRRCEPAGRQAGQVWGGTSEKRKKNKIINHTKPNKATLMHF